MTKKTHSYYQIYKALPAIIFIFSLYSTIVPAATIQGEKLSISANQDDFDAKFRQGRELIDKEEWAKAAEKFAEIVDKYPDHKTTDAALYWLAFCQKKQKQYKESAATVDRLLQNFPSSSWASDAKVLRLELLSSGSNSFSVAGIGKSSGGSFGITSTTAASKAALEGYLFNDVYSTVNDRATLEREEEVKLAAFQSLLSADPKRGVEAMIQLLQPGSKAGENLKLEVLRVVRLKRFGGYQFYPATGFGTTAKTLKNDVSSVSVVGEAKVLTANSASSSQLTPLLKDAMFKLLPNESNVKIRTEMINLLASLNDDDALNYLVQLYSSERDKETKKAILNSFLYSSGNYMYYLPSLNSTETVATGQNSNRPTQKIQFTKLLEIAQTEKDAELRALALNNLQRFNGWNTNPQIIPVLSKLYDDETNEEFKTSIMRTLANTGQNSATKKLLDIARNEKSDKLKIEAIRLLGKSKDPEALKYLEDLIK